MIALAALPHSTYAVLGLGRSGQASASALLAAGKTVFAWDDDPRARDAAVAAGLALTDLATVSLEGVDALVLSPGIPHTYPAPHPLAVRAREAGIPIIGDIELLFQAQPTARFIGITGTNGKSTTTALIGHILGRCGVDCEVGGNLGPPAMGFRTLGAGGTYVLEMSSYQLELTPSAAFQVAVLLNITPDHLGRHGGMEGYVAAKRRIFARPPGNAAQVIGIDDEPCRALCRELMATTGGWVVPVSTREQPSGGVFVADRRLCDATGAGAPEPVLDMRQALALPGEHNGQNAAAAYAAARAIGLDRDAIVAAILDFPGLAHRQERIGVVDGVVYVNDSKATNPEAAEKALASYETIYWIAGGRPKEGGLGALDAYLGRIRHAFLIGEASAQFAAELQGRVPLSEVGTLDRAVTAARALAETERLPGATVLLSPACASFDQFRNFEVRGDAFRQLVEQMAR
jgi:UDP-N-acetylmuramoylalanine--D-glutamate ligase